MNLDGIHRLLAWVIFEKTEEMIPAYVIGLPRRLKFDAQKFNNYPF